MEAVNEYVSLNGVRQSLMTMRTDPKNPVLLIVHGGAGCPDRPLVREFSACLAEAYTVVCWDQRGCGFSDAGGKLTVNLLLSDLKALVSLLRERYRQDRIFIAGHSWGSYLALRYAAAYPETVAYYIGTGQEISADRDEPDKYRFVLERARQINDTRVLKKLAYYGAPDGYSYARRDKQAKSFIWKTVFRYTGYFSKSGPGLGGYAPAYLRLYVRCYGAKLGKLLLGVARSLSPLNGEMYLADSITEITELPFPVLLISGAEDMICPVVTVQRWFDRLNAPKKEYVIVPDASHMINFERPDVWNGLVLGLPAEQEENGADQ